MNEPCRRRAIYAEREKNVSPVLVGVSSSLSEADMSKSHVILNPNKVSLHTYACARCKKAFKTNKGLLVHKRSCR